MSKHNVFAYGTLKRDEPNFSLLTNKENGEARMVGEAETVERFPLVIASKYNIPFVLDQPGTGNHVKGEVFSVDDKMLARIDVLEDFPNFYNRKKINVKLFNKKDETIEVWIYVIQSFKPQLLKLPFITDYHSAGPHGLVYTGNSKRIPGYVARDDVKIN